ncbi:MAG: TfoX/Sxy family protein [Ruminococcus sp.]|nr:TfoX/Sxy family protein [Ruminococcus sp.]
MATSKEYYNFIMEQLSELENVRSRKMMGEYIIYYKNKVIGGIYDNRFLIKPTESARNFMPDAPLELPYENAKEMLLVENIDDRQFLAVLLNAVAEELPEIKKKR